MLTSDEIAQIVDALDERAEARRELRTRADDPGGEFYIPAKQHYDQHERMDRFLDLVESSASTVWKSLLVFMLLGLIGLVIIGFKLNK